MSIKILFRWVSVIDEEANFDVLEIQFMAKLGGKCLTLIIIVDTQ